MPGIDTASISLTAETNQDTLAREAILTISGENVPLQTVAVWQAPRPVLSVSASELGIGSLEGSIGEFMLTSNQDWIIALSWLHKNPLFTLFTPCLPVNTPLQTSKNPLPGW